MRTRRISAMAVGTLAAAGAVPLAANAAHASSPNGATLAAAEPATEAIIEGARGDFISVGYLGVASPPAQQITVSGGNVVGSGFDGVYFTVANLPGQQPWTLTGALAAPSGSALAAGTSYSNAQRMIDAVQPRIDITATGADGSGRGCNVTAGSFTVEQLAIVNGAITQFEADFTQYCDGGPGMRGLIRYNATGPAPAGAPTGQLPAAPAGSVAPITFVRGQQIISNQGSGTDGSVIATLPLQNSLGDVQMAWTPLRTRMIFKTGQGLTSVAPDGSTAQPIARQPGAGEPAVSPDGSVVAYINTNQSTGTSTLLVTDSDGKSAGSPYQLPLNGPTCVAEHFPTFAPDGSLLYQCDQSVAAPAPDTYRRANGVSSLLIANAAHAVASPDGSQIAFVRPDGNGVAQIFTVGADGKTGLKQVTQNPWPAVKPAWSPDGKYLAYVNTAFGEIIEIPAAGGAPVGSIPNADDPAWTPPVSTEHVVREWGADRVGTAIAASQLNFAAQGDTSDVKRSQAGALVLARSDNFADALGGSALAVRKNAPLLITPTGQLDPAVGTEIHRVLAPGGTVYLLGGDSALSPKVSQALAGYTVVRLAGADRYATAVAIATTIDPHPRTVLLATGDNYPDALAAGATAEPVLLTSGTVMPKATAEFLNRLNPDPAAPSGTQIVTIGGPGDTALISGYQHNAMPSWPSQINRLKLAGSTRYATALTVAQTFFTSNTDLAFATGASWPDALSGGAMIGHRGGPLLLTDPAGIGPDLLAYLTQESGSLYALHLLGGPNALPNAIAQQAAGAFGTPGHVQIGALTPGAPLPLVVTSKAVTPLAGQRPAATGQPATTPSAPGTDPRPETINRGP